MKLETVIRRRRGVAAAARLAALVLLLTGRMLAQAQGFACTAGDVTTGLWGLGASLQSSLGALAGGAASVGAGAGQATLPGGGGAAACAPTEPASVPVDAPSTLAGNPVDLVTGTKVDRAIDLDRSPARPAPLDDAASLVVSRFYASGSAGSAALGPGWRLGLEARLYAARVGGRTVLQVVQGDGRTVRFGPPRSTGAGTMRHVARAREDGELERVAGARGGWVWHWRNGRRLSFDQNGRLRRIASFSGAELALEYDRVGRLSEVRGADGRGVALRYHAAQDGRAGEAGAPSPGAHPGRLAALEDSGGTAVRYRYDAVGRLVGVHYHDGARVAYEYQGPRSARLVAVVLPDGRRSEYRYDANGRVVLSRAAGDVSRRALRFAYLPSPGPGAGGVTEVREGESLRATYRWAPAGPDGSGRLVFASGTGCERCPATGRRYRYDRAGRLVHVDRLAGPTPEARGPGSSTFSIGRDASGRPHVLRWRLAGEERVVRIDWMSADAVDLPERVEWPSVVPGRSVRLQVLRDAQLRTVSFEQFGYAPLVIREADGRLRVAATPIKRVSTMPVGASPDASAIEAGAASGVTARSWHDDFGRLVAWWSEDSGLVRRIFDAHDRLRRETRADGSVAHFEYDAVGRMTSMQEVTPPVAAGGTEPAAVTTTRFEWSGAGLVAVEDDEGRREVFDRDAAGRLVRHRLSLRLDSGGIAEFESRFEYDGADRLVAWSLPAGDTIRAMRDAQGQVVSLEWHPRAAAWSQPLVSALSRDARGLHRMVFGNDIVATTHRTASGDAMHIRHRRARGASRSDDVQNHLLRFDDSGRLREWRRGAEARTYLYDRQSRLLQAVHRSGRDALVWRFAYDARGNRRLAQQAADLHEASAGHLGESLATRDPAGRLVFDGRRTHRWDAGGRLREIREGGRLVASYRYDHRGQRVAKRVDGVTTHFLYDARRRPLAEIDADGQVRRQYVYLADLPVAVLDRADPTADHTRGPKAAFRVRYLHLDHLGAPEAATDERARVVWRASYAPFGRRLGASSAGHGAAATDAFELPLRLPGQYEDPETGLHYNDHRYYDPDAGRYLSPDPLGPAAGPNPYVYAGNDPLTRVDPSGLLLFAFDGTDNGDPPSRRDDWSNVYKLARSYSDGRVWYMAGVGRDDAGSGIRTNGLDAINANTARARVDFLLAELQAAVSGAAANRGPIDVDVVGFSRGAAMARDFSNRVADRIRGGAFAQLGACVRLRFLGLWDTVAQFGADGISNAGWRLAIPVETAYAAHAVALNEHRTLFPAESIVGSPLAGVRIERGFVGAHSDVGGSYAEGDLSDVALVWMHAQALQAGVGMFALTSEFARVSAPLLHDSSGGSGDREFRYRNSWGWTYANPLQRVAKVDGLQWRDTGQFIRRFPEPRDDVYGEPTLAGEVDMLGYSAWLDSNYGIALGAGP